MIWLSFILFWWKSIKPKHKLEFSKLDRIILSKIWFEFVLESESGLRVIKYPEARGIKNIGFLAVYRIFNNIKSKKRNTKKLKKKQKYVYITCRFIIMRTKVIFYPNIMKVPRSLVPVYFLQLFKQKSSWVGKVRCEFIVV